MALKSPTTNTSSGQFKLVDKVSKKCVPKGVIGTSKRSKRLAVLSGDIDLKENTTSAYLLSPVFVSTGKLSFSVHDFQFCNGSRLQAFLIPDHFDGSAIVAASSLSSSAFFDLRPKEPFSNNWRFNRIVKAVPSKYEKFHVLLKATVVNNSTCRVEIKNYCEITSTVAIDEISVESFYEECTAGSGNGSVLDSNFENGSSGSWNTQGTTVYDSKTKTESFHSSQRMLVDKVFTGRSKYVLGFDMLRDKAALVSPKLVAKSNCSCSMSFEYFRNLQKNYDSAEVNLIQKFGVDRSLHAKHQKTLFRSNRKRHVKKTWESAEVSINLVDDGVPFQFELNTAVIDETRGYFFLDNIVFRNCDISIYEEKKHDLA